MKKCLVMLTMLISLQAYAQTSYLCIADAMTGFNYDKILKKYVTANFNINDEKYILKNTKEGWEWSNFGSTTGTSCGELRFETLTCDLVAGRLKFNKNTLRYLRTYELGYVSGRNSNDDTPVISIGKCSPL